MGLDLVRKILPGEKFGTWILKYAPVQIDELLEKDGIDYPAFVDIDRVILENVAPEIFPEGSIDRLRREEAANDPDHFSDTEPMYGSLTDSQREDGFVVRYEVAHIDLNGNPVDLSIYRNPIDCVVKTTIEVMVRSDRPVFLPSGAMPNLQRIREEWTSLNNLLAGDDARGSTRPAFIYCHDAEKGEAYLEFKVADPTPDGINEAIGVYSSVISQIIQARPVFEAYKEQLLKQGYNDKLDAALEEARLIIGQNFTDESPGSVAIRHAFRDFCEKANPAINEIVRQQKDSLQRFNASLFQQFSEVRESLLQYLQRPPYRLEPGK